MTYIVVQGHTSNILLCSAWMYVQYHWTNSVYWTKLISANEENGIILSYNSPKNRVIAQMYKSRVGGNQNETAEIHISTVPP